MTDSGLWAILGPMAYEVTETVVADGALPMTKGCSHPCCYFCNIYPKWGNSTPDRGAS